jgi:hypothetical protein
MAEYRIVEVLRALCEADDLLASIGRGLTFAQLLRRCTEMAIAPGVRVRVLDLEVVISTKEFLASEKDLAALPVLRQTLKERNRNKG